MRKPQVLRLRLAACAAKLRSGRQYFSSIGELIGAEDFGEVLGSAGGVLGDLFAATEAVGDEDVGWGGAACGWQEDSFAEGLRDGVVLAFKAKRACHAAAAGVEEFDLCAGAAEPLEFVFHVEDGFVVAVAVEEDAGVGVLGGLVVGRVAGEELAEQEGLVGEAFCAVVAGEEVEELVAEDAGATGFEEDDGQAGVDLRRELGEDAA